MNDVHTCIVLSVQVHYLWKVHWCFLLVLLLFRHEAERLEQKAKGDLERQKITDEAEAEKARKKLLELQANRFNQINVSLDYWKHGIIFLFFFLLSSAAVESTGQAKAEAQSRAEASRIEGEANVEQAKLKAQASKIEAVSVKSCQWSQLIILFISWTFDCIGIRAWSFDEGSWSRTEVHQGTERVGHCEGSRTRWNWNREI